MKKIELSELIQSNPGAVDVTSQILRLPDHVKIFNWLYRQGHTGEKMWMLYKDVYRQDVGAMVRAIRTDISGQTGVMNRQG